MYPYLNCRSTCFKSLVDHKISMFFLSDSPMFSDRQTKLPPPSSSNRRSHSSCSPRHRCWRGSSSWDPPASRSPAPFFWCFVPVEKKKKRYDFLWTKNKIKLFSTCCVLIIPTFGSETECLQRIQHSEIVATNAKHVGNEQKLGF